MYSILTKLFLLLALFVNGDSYASDTAATQNILFADFAKLEQVHASGDAPINEQEFLENILKRKNEHVRSQIDALISQQQDEEKLSELQLTHWILLSDYFT